MTLPELRQKLTAAQAALTEAITGELAAGVRLAYEAKLAPSNFTGPHRALVDGALTRHSTAHAITAKARESVATLTDEIKARKATLAEQIAEAKEAIGIAARNREVVFLAYTRCNIWQDVEAIYKSYVAALHAEDDAHRQANILRNELKERTDG